MIKHNKSRLIPRSTAIKQIYGNLDKIGLSSQSLDATKRVIGENNDLQAFPPDQREAIKKALLKEAETLERFGIPLRRAFSDLVIQPEQNKTRGGSYSSKDDIIKLGFVPGADPYLQALRNFIHENKHRALFMPYGRFFADELRKQQQLNTVEVPFQSEYDYQPNTDWGRGSSIVYGPLMSSLEPVYSQGDYGFGYPVELLPTTAGNIIAPDWNPYCPDTGYVPRYGVEQLRQMLTRTGKNASTEEPDIKKEANPRKHYPVKERVTITEGLVKTMKQLAVTKEALRNVLARYQNKTMGLLQLIRSPDRQKAQRDRDRILQNDDLMGITNPAFYQRDNQDDYYAALQHPVAREPDGFMQKIIDDDLFKHLNGISVTPPGAFSRKTS